MDTTSARGSNPASNATGHPGLGRILRRRTGCGRRGASGGMASAWLVVAVLVAHVASVNAVFKPTTKDELSYAKASCLTNVASGVQCCAASPYCNSGAGTASFTDDIGDWDTSLITDMSTSVFEPGVVQRRHQRLEYLAGHVHGGHVLGRQCFQSTDRKLGHLASHGHE